MHIACIDAGTTSCRTIIFAYDGRLASQAQQEYSSIFLSPTWIEHDPATWINAARETLAQALAKLPAGERELAAICVISQRATLTPVDRQGIPLAHAILWQDKRSTGQAERIQREVGAEFIYGKTGLRIDPYFSLPKLLWLQENQPDLLARTHKLLAVHDLIVHSLTGRLVTEWTQASRTMLFNIQSFKWDQELCQRFGIPLELLPEAVPPGTVVGGLRPSLRRELGLTSDVPVVAVGGDQQAAAVGLGVVRPGLLGVNSGTGSFVLAHAERPVFDPRRRVILTASPVAGKWLLEGSVITSGCVYRWFRDNFGKPASDAEVTRAGPGARGVALIPHFAGAAAPYWDPDAAGVLYGLNLGHTRADITRAILEGICLEIWKNIRIIEELTAPASEVRVSGGATRSALFRQIQADVYGQPVLRAACEEASAVGAMIVADAAIGRYPDVPTAAEAMAAFDTRGRKLPDPQAHQVYEQLLLRHEAIYQALRSQTR